MKRARVLPAPAVLTACLLAGVLAVALAPRAGATELSSERQKARAVAAEVVALDARLDTAVAEYAAAAQDLAYLKDQIERNRHELDISRFQLEDAQDALGDRAVAMYKNGEVSFLDVLLDSSTFDELLTEVDYFRRVGVRDSQIVASVEARRERVRAQGEQLEADVAKAERLAERAAATRSQIEAALGEREALLQTVRDDVARLERAARERAQRAARQQAQRQAAGSVSEAPAAPSGQGTWWPVIKRAAADNGVSAQGLYRLMMIESGGVASISNGVFFGLYQYCRGTWEGSWNPWRGRDILDGEAQIKATALAIRMGKGPYWWPNTYGWAFSQ